MRTSNPASLRVALPVLGALLLLAGEARATDATEVPDNGSEQGGRGGAWVARASDPLAAFYNPAGLAGQPTRLVLQGNFGSQRTCFTRIKAKNDTTQDGISPGATYPQVCNGAGYSPDPQLAMTIRVSPKVGIGIAPLMAPSAANGSSSYPEFATVGGMPNQPEPGRYILTDQTLILVTPTIAIGAEIVDRLRVGASLQFGLATFAFTNASMGQNQDMTTPATNDLKSKLTGHDLFIPGFTLGTIWSPTDTIDLAGWYKWSAPVDASGDVNVQYNYYAATAANQPKQISTTDTSQPNCGFNGPSTAGHPCGSGSASVHFARPMEAKIGVRYHLPRKGIPYDEHTRDPIAQDVFDAEIDGTWANDSALDVLQIRFPGNAAGVGSIPINGTPATIPPNADLPLHYSDVFGVRVGGDVNVLPDQLAIRGGAFYQTPSQTGQNQQYQGLAFATGSMVGLALGSTYRIHVGSGSSAIEVSAGFEHVFVSTESYDGTGGVYALAGTQCNPSATATVTSAGTVCPNGGREAYRSNWAINLGSITNSINIINAGLGYRF